MEFRKNFFETHLAQLEALEKRQKIYQKAITATVKIPEEARATVKFEHAVAQLRKERNELRAQIWVANSQPNKREDQRYIRDLECHIDCQENLSQDIDYLKAEINKIERTSQRTGREICALNRRIIPEAQHIRHVVQFRKKIEMLENQLEASLRLECSFKAENAKLREEVINLLEDRLIFHERYTKLMQRLSNDKKYLSDLMEHALDKFEDCLELYDKMQGVAKKEARDTEKLRDELANNMRDTAAEMSIQRHMEKKLKQRHLADLPDKEYLRREKVTQSIERKITLYNKVMGRISAHARSHQLENIIETFKQHESLYYSYFNYSNEISYHVTLVDHAVNQLAVEIQTLLGENREVQNVQLEIMGELETKLKEQQRRNILLKSQSDAQDLRLQNLLNSFQEIFEICRADATPLFSLLGNHSHVHLVNIPRVLKILERRIYNITAGLYVLERLDESNNMGGYTVRLLHKYRTWPTAIDDIVLTQQCPECAEGDILNADEAGDAAIYPNTTQEVRKKLHEKVVQPEMQYRLHSIEECKHPRSRMLTAKKNA